jgi:2-keto-3-deoxy-L-rhamnonate aldolase RhmA
MQNAGIAALGLDWRYLACEVAPTDLAAALKQRDAIVAKQAATISRLNQAKTQLQQRLADNQARLAQARKTR